MTLKQLQKRLDKNDGSGYVRYIRLGNGEFEFEDVKPECKHKKMAEGKDVASAGFVLIRPRVLNVTGTPASTEIGVGRKKQDALDLGHLLNREPGCY